MCLPSGEKYGFVSSPGCAVSRLAPVPSAPATQTSSPYTNAILPSVIAGEARRRVSDVPTAGPGGAETLVARRKGAAHAKSKASRGRLIIVGPVRPGGPRTDPSGA